MVKAGLASELFSVFLKRFWTYDESSCVREKLESGQRIGRRHRYNMLVHVKNLFGTYLSDSGLAPKSVNNVTEPERVALRWAHDNDL